MLWAVQCIASTLVRNNDSVVLSAAVGGLKGELWRKNLLSPTTAEGSWRRRGAQKPSRGQYVQLPWWCRCCSSVAWEGFGIPSYESPTLSSEKSTLHDSPVTYSCYPTVTETRQLLDRESPHTSCRSKVGFHRCGKKRVFMQEKRTTRAQAQNYDIITAVSIRAFNCCCFVLRPVHH